MPRDAASSSLPTWIGPQYYPDAGNKPKLYEHDTQYRLPFKSAPRDAKSEEVLKRTAASRRRRVLTECKQRISASSSVETNSRDRGISTGGGNGNGNGNGAHDGGFNTSFAEGSSAVATGGGGGRPTSTPKVSALELARKDFSSSFDADNAEESALELMLKQNCMIGIDEEDDGGRSLASSLTMNSNARSHASRDGTGTVRGAEPSQWALKTILWTCWAPQTRR